MFFEADPERINLFYITEDLKLSLTGVSIEIVVKKTSLWV
jgi:hypothetical protein